MTNLANHPAFPSPQSGQAGMTYRQWLVGMALQGVSSNPFLLQQMNEMKGMKATDINPTLAAAAVALADAAIERQGKP